MAQNFLLLQSFVIKYTPHDHMGAVKLFSHLTYLQGQVLVPAGASGLQKFADGEAFLPTMNLSENTYHLHEHAEHMPSAQLRVKEV